MSSGFFGFCLLGVVWWQRLLSSLSALGGARGRIAAAPGFSDRFGDRQAARRMEELAGTGSVAFAALGLNGSLSESTCQDAIRTLRATADLAGLALP